MLRTTIISVGRKQEELHCYLTAVTEKAKNLRNAATFLLRNLYTGLGKLPADRHPLENEAIYKVITGLMIHNARSEAAREAFLASDTYRELPEEEKAPAYKKFCARHGIYSIPDSRHRTPSAKALTTALQEMNDPDYRALPGQVNQRAVAKSVSDWKAGWACMKAWKQDPSRFNGKPSLPGYIRTARTEVSFSSQICKIIPGDGGKQYLRFPKTDAVLCLGHMNLPGSLQSVDVVPKDGRYDMMLVFRTADPDIPKPHAGERIYAIDPGVDNFATVAGNFPMTPFILCGRRLKSVNRLYNKKMADFLSQVMGRGENRKGWKITIPPECQKTADKRDRFLRDTFYKMAHYICRQAVKDHVTLIVAGKNRYWKQRVPMDKTNSQNFVQLPHARFLRILQHVSMQYGIRYEEQEESYTSKSDFLEQDFIPVYGTKEAQIATFSGKRTCRGQYRSKNGTVLNADVNGALNILRKHVPEAFRGITDFRYAMTNIRRVTYRMLQPNA